MKTLLKQALDALKDITQTLAWQQWEIHLGYTAKMQRPDGAVSIAKNAIAALDAELAKPDHDPVAWVHVSDTKMPWDKTLPYKFAFVKDESWACAVPLYAVPLRSPTDAELVELACDSKNCEGNSMLPVAFAREVEALVTGTRNCSRHPDAPHGFDRNGSHASGRYVCTCENWKPGEAS